MISEHEQMLKDLAGAGLLDPQWRAAFEKRTRHLFVPTVVWRLDEERTRLDRYTDERAWLAAAYADEPLITQWNDGGPLDDLPAAQASSSISMPSVVALMLREAQIGDGMRVLEIGAGSGWNVALLDARLGTGNVFSVEVDPAIADSARTHLRRVGANVHVETGDGEGGLPAHAPYDRIISTASVSRLPHAWIEQTKPGGFILTPWFIQLCNGLLLRLQATGDGTAVGRFVDNADFMPMRGQRPPREDVTPSTEGRVSETAIDPRTILNGDHAQYVAGLLVPNCWAWVAPHDGLLIQRLDDPTTESWATATLNPSRGRYTVAQDGPRRLWDEICAAHSWWLDQGQPVFTRFGVTADRHGHAVWLDEPANVVYPR